MLLLLKLHKNMDNKKKIPLGLRYIRAISILLIIALIMIVSMSQFFKINFFTFVGFTETLTMFLSLAISVFTIYCINRPKPSLYKILIALLGIDILLNIPSFATLNFNFFYPNILSVLFILVFIWYITKVKTYFTTGQINVDDPVVKKADKRFKVFLILWFIFMFVIPLIISVVIDTQGKITFLKQSIEYAKNFQGKTFDQNTAYCQSQGSQSEECLINLIGQEVGAKKTVSVDSCSVFTTDTGKLSCYSILQRCDLVTGGDNMKQICESASRKFQKYTTSDKAQ